MMFDKATCIFICLILATFRGFAFITFETKEGLENALSDKKPILEGKMVFLFG